MTGMDGRWRVKCRFGSGFYMAIGIDRGELIRVMKEMIEKTGSSRTLVQC